MISKKCRQKNAVFFCEKCDFKCFKKSNFEKHLSTLKHIYGHNGNNLEMLEIDQKNQKKEYFCECGKTYGTNSGLWKHKKKCQKMPKNATSLIDTNTTNNNINNIICGLVAQQTEINQKILELSSEKTNITNYNNKHNTFNLQVFLNETCKDALNISDFVNQIKLSIDDLEETGNIGYVNGISKVVINNLNDINFSERPIHCSDSKREIIYIKDDGKWHREDDEKPILTKAIKDIAGKNIRQITEWQKLHPDFSDPESKCNDKYIQIVMNSMSGSSKEECDKNYEKIIKNVTKETVINKQNLKLK